MYLNELRGDVWTIETKDRGFKDVELFAPLQGQAAEEDLHRRGQPPKRFRPTGRRRSPTSIRTALEHIAPEQLIVSSDCGFGRQGCNREIAFYKASAIAQGCNIVRKELGLETTYVPAADPALADRYRAEDGVVITRLAFRGSRLEEPSDRSRSTRIRWSSEPPAASSEPRAASERSYSFRR